MSGQASSWKDLKDRKPTGRGRFRPVFWAYSWRYYLLGDGLGHYESTYNAYLRIFRDAEGADYPADVLDFEPAQDCTQQDFTQRAKHAKPSAASEPFLYYNSNLKQNTGLGQNWWTGTSDVQV
jgi:hypothetical protein